MAKVDIREAMTVPSRSPKDHVHSQYHYAAKKLALWVTKAPDTKKSGSFFKNAHQKSDYSLEVLECCNVRSVEYFSYILLVI